MERLEEEGLGASDGGEEVRPESHLRLASATADRLVVDRKFLRKKTFLGIFRRLKFDTLQLGQVHA